MTARHALTLLLLASASTLSPPAASAAGRLLRVDDLFALKSVRDPRLSPDGKWVAYTVTTLDAKEDQSDTDVWMAPIAGGEAVRLTSSPKPETRPRFSPDGKWLAFLSGREGKKTQVYLMNRSGGEAVKLTDYKASVSDLAWSPDSKRLALVVSDVDPDDPDTADAGGGDKDKEKTPKPIVTRRLQFMRDGQGFLREVRSHLHVFDVATKLTFQLTSGPHDDSDPAWSPDGQQIAFTSNRTPEPDANRNSDIFVVAARPNQTPRALTTANVEDSNPAFSPDGKWIAYVEGAKPEDMWYGANHVSIVPVSGGAAKALTAALDRNVFQQPRFSPDGRYVHFILEDGGNEHLARVPSAGGAVERPVAGERSIDAFDVSPKGDIVVLESQHHYPGEISTVTATGLKRVTTVNDAFLAGVRLGKVERIKAKSADGTPIEAFFTLPPDATPGQRLPTLLRIHGGPTSQYSASFDFSFQLFAARGYAVVAPNPRGSTGYGTAFSRAIWADWGNKDTEDVLAAVDQAIAMGVADPDRLGVGGWSYGGILTNYVVAKTTRFRGAISGASISNILAGYGTDHYQYEYETELGLPWKNRDAWLRLSSPFLEADKIKTPTLFLCGQDDMNVPLLNTEQMYQAVRRLGVPTELVIYPGQNHGIAKPSYQKDRLERYLAWYDRHVLGRQATVAAAKPAEAVSLLGSRPLYAPELTDAARKPLEDNLAKATADFVKDPDNADNIIWLGRRLAYLGRYRDAIAVFTRGIAKFPEDIRMYRHRGHRYVTVRELDNAIKDFDRAAELIAAKNIPDQIEPDGAPNVRNVPTSTSHFNVFYHLGLAHYLKGDFAAAEKAYRECMKYSMSAADSLVATSDWLYMTLRRQGKTADAAKVLEPIRKDLDVIESVQYRDRLLMYKGEKTPEEIVGAGGSDTLSIATYGYGLGNWYLINGQTAKAREVFEKVVDSPNWAAFGYIAAEAELARMK